MPVELFDIDKGFAVFSKGNYQTKKHSHYAIEIIVATQGTFSITTPSGAYTNLKSSIIPSNRTHTFDCKDAEVSLLFADPLSIVGKYLMRLFDLPGCNDLIVEPPELELFWKDGRFDISHVLEDPDIDFFEGIDSRIQNCIRIVNSHTSNKEITVAQLSKETCLSESRLSHLFKDQLGITVHQCVLWKKIQLAVEKSRQGYSLTECAYHAGFSDSSHLNKIFYKMFGVPPFFVLKT